jgi:hypothetical protein
MLPLVWNCIKSFRSPTKWAQVGTCSMQVVTEFSSFFPKNSSAVKQHLCQGIVKYAYLHVIIKVVVLLVFILVHGIHLIFKTQIVLVYM